MDSRAQGPVIPSSGAADQPNGRGRPRRAARALPDGNAPDARRIAAPRPHGAGWYNPGGLGPLLGGSPGTNYTLLDVVAARGGAAPGASDRIANPCPRHGRCPWTR